jgi:hypothetical protein
VDVLGNVGVVEQRGAVLAQGALKRGEVAGLVGADQVGHGGDLRVGAVRARLGRVKGIHGRALEHAGQHKVAQAVQLLGRPGLVVALKGLEEARVGQRPRALGQRQLPAALVQRAQHERVRDGGARGELGPRVGGPQPGRVAVRSVLRHLEHADLEQLRAARRVEPSGAGPQPRSRGGGRVHAARAVEVGEHGRQARVVARVRPGAACPAAAAS